MKILVSFIGAALVFGSWSQVCLGQTNWGVNGLAVGPTADGMHDSLKYIADQAQAAGMDIPDVEGSEGATTMGGIQVYMFDTTGNPEIKYNGLTSIDSPYAIAFNKKAFLLKFPSDKLSTDKQCRLVSAYAHEHAHVQYGVYFDDWCATNPTACADYKTCVKGLKKYADGAGPCDEQYSYAKEAEALCEAICKVCKQTEPPMSSTKKALYVGKLKELQEQANKECSAAAADCMAAATCASIPPPLPPDTPPCGTSTCACETCPP